MCRGWLATRQSAGAASLLGDVLPGACCFVALVHAGGTYLPAHLIQPSSDFLVHVRVCTRTHTHTHTHTLLLYTLTFLASRRAESITALKCHSP